MHSKEKGITRNYNKIMGTQAARQKSVLRSIVRTYIDEASPVGSHHLVKKYRLNYSPATIRNEMANLENMGYIERPHASAGRIPTDRGYRFYVGSLMKQEKLSRQEHERIHEQIEKAGGDVNHVLEEASRILGRISKELGVVLTPWISWGVFDRLELIELSEKKVLVVIHVRSRLVKTVILKVESELKQGDLEKTASVINERLSGLTLEEIKNTIDHRVRDAGRGNRMLMHRVVESAPELFDFSTEHLEVHTCGTHNILNQPEFSNVGMLESILSLIDNKRHLIHLFHRKVSKTEVIIGQENGDEALKSFTIIMTCYNRGKDMGTLGVIGPTRMQYRKILPLMDFMAKTMSQFLS